MFFLCIFVFAHFWTSQAWALAPNTASEIQAASLTSHLMDVFQARSLMESLPSDQTIYLHDFDRLCEQKRNIVQFCSYMEQHNQSLQECIRVAFSAQQGAQESFHQLLETFHQQWRLWERQSRWLKALLLANDQDVYHGSNVKTLWAFEEVEPSSEHSNRTHSARLQQMHQDWLTIQQACREIQNEDARQVFVSMKLDVYQAAMNTLQDLLKTWEAYAEVYDLFIGMTGLDIPSQDTLFLQGLDWLPHMSLWRDTDVFSSTEFGQEEEHEVCAKELKDIASQRKVWKKEFQLLASAVTLYAYYMDYRDKILTPQLLFCKQACLPHAAMLRKSWVLLISWQQWKLSQHDQDDDWDHLLEVFTKLDQQETHRQMDETAVKNLARAKKIAGTAFAKVLFDRLTLEFSRLLASIRMRQTQTLSDAFKYLHSIQNFSDYRASYRASAERYFSNVNGGSIKNMLPEWCRFFQRAYLLCALCSRYGLPEIEDCEPKYTFFKDCLNQLIDRFMTFACDLQIRSLEPFEAELLCVAFWEGLNILTTKEQSTPNSFFNLLTEENRTRRISFAEYVWNEIALKHAEKVQSRGWQPGSALAASLLSPDFLCTVSHCLTAFNAGNYCFIIDLFQGDEKRLHLALEIAMRLEQNKRHVWLKVFFDRVSQGGVDISRFLSSRSFQFSEDEGTLLQEHFKWSWSKPDLRVSSFYVQLLAHLRQEQPLIISERQFEKRLSSWLRRYAGDYHAFKKVVCSVQAFMSPTFLTHHLDHLLRDCFSAQDLINMLKEAWQGQESILNIRFICTILRALVSKCDYHILLQDPVLGLLKNIPLILCAQLFQLKEQHRYVGPVNQHDTSLIAKDFECAREHIDAATHLQVLDAYKEFLKSCMTTYRAAIQFLAPLDRDKVFLCIAHEALSFDPQLWSFENADGSPNGVRVLLERMRTLLPVERMGTLLPVERMRTLLPASDRGLVSISSLVEHFYQSSGGSESHDARIAKDLDKLFEVLMQNEWWTKPETQKAARQVFEIFQRICCLNDKPMSIDPTILASQFIDSVLQCVNDQNFSPMTSEFRELAVSVVTFVAQRADFVRSSCHSVNLPNLLSLIGDDSRLRQKVLDALKRSPCLFAVDDRLLQDPVLGRPENIPLILCAQLFQLKEQHRYVGPVNQRDTSLSAKAFECAREHLNVANHLQDLDAYKEFLQSCMTTYCAAIQSLTPLDRDKVFLCIAHEALSFDPQLWSFENADGSPNGVRVLLERMETLLPASGRGLVSISSLVEHFYQSSGGSESHDARIVKDLDKLFKMLMQNKWWAKPETQKAARHMFELFQRICLNDKPMGIDPITLASQFIDSVLQCVNDQNFSPMTSEFRELAVSVVTFVAQHADFVRSSCHSVNLPNLLSLIGDDSRLRQKVLDALKRSPCLFAVDDRLLQDPVLGRLKNIPLILCAQLFQLKEQHRYVGPVNQRDRSLSAQAFECAREHIDAATHLQVLDAYKEFLKSCMTTYRAAIQFLAPLDRDKVFLCIAHEALSFDPQLWSFENADGSPNGVRVLLERMETLLPASGRGLVSISSLVEHFYQSSGGSESHDARIVKDLDKLFKMLMQNKWWAKPETQKAARQMFELFQRICLNDKPMGIDPITLASQFIDSVLQCVNDQNFSPMTSEFRELTVSVVTFVAQRADFVRSSCHSVNLPNLLSLIGDDCRLRQKVLEALKRSPCLFAVDDSSLIQLKRSETYLGRELQPDDMMWVTSDLRSDPLQSNLTANKPDADFETRVSAMLWLTAHPQASRFQTLRVLKIISGQQKMNSIPLGSIQTLTKGVAEPHLDINQLARQIQPLAHAYVHNLVLWDKELCQAAYLALRELVCFQAMYSLVPLSEGAAYTLLQEMEQFHLRCWFPVLRPRRHQMLAQQTSMLDIERSCTTIDVSLSTGYDVRQSDSWA